MTLNWQLLLDADMDEEGWQFSTATDATVLRIDQINPPEIGRFALAQVSLDQSEFLSNQAYPARAESLRVSPDYVGEGQRLIAVRVRYGEFSQGVENNWRVQIYGAKAEFQPPINPTAVVLTLDPRIAGAIPLEEKGVALGVATLDADGVVPDAQLLGSALAELVGANMEAVDALANQVSSLPFPPTLESLGAEPVGAETRAKAYTDQQVTALQLSELIAKITLLEAALPKNFLHIWGNTNKTSNGKSWQITNSSTYELGRTAQFNPPALGDYAEFDYSLTTGTYQFVVCHTKANSSGIVTIYLNDVQIGQTDFYSSTTQNNQRYICNFTVTDKGMQRFKVQVTSKNASSLNYFFNVSNVQCFPVDLSLIQTIRINAGDTTDYTANDGNVWKADYGYSGTSNGYNTETTLGETFTVANTSNQRIYKTERSIEGGNTFTYDLYVGQAGNFTLKLLFCESYYTTAGQRIGTVKLNGSSLLTNFDILAETARRTALVKAWNNLSLSGTIQISFTNMLVNGIEIIRSS